jgi:glutamate synthase domain-containing protein 2
MDPIKRSRYLVLQKGKHVANYHNELIYGVRSLLAVMGKSNTSELGMDDLIYHN